MPINVYKDGRTSADPVIVMAGAKENTDAPNVGDFAIPAGLTYRTLILGIDESGQERAVAAASDMNNPATCKIVAYSLDGTAQWVEDLDVSCDQVSANNQGRIHAVMLDEASGSVTIQEYAPAAQPAPAPAEADLPATIPADYIKTLDFKHLPARSHLSDNCTAMEGAPTLENVALMNSFAKMPNPSEINDDCWYLVPEEGAWQGGRRYWIETLPNDPDNPHPTEYEDVNGDGFLDAKVTMINPAALIVLLYVFDPADPQHPWGAYLDGWAPSANFCADKDKCIT